MLPGDAEKVKRYKNLYAARHFYQVVKKKRSPKKTDIKGILPAH